MHSRIFQVSSEPITEENLIEEYRYDEWEHADYVVKQTSSTDIKSDLEWLQTANSGIKVNVEEKTITITSKEEYFTKSHDKFKELAEELSTISLEDFISGKANIKFHDLKCAYEDKYGFYIDDNDEYCGLTNLDDWVRNAEENKTYYVGNIFDYHF
jgi:hypothetical protein